MENSNSPKRIVHGGSFLNNGVNKNLFIQTN